MNRDVPYPRSCIELGEFWLLVVWVSADIVVGSGFAAGLVCCGVAVYRTAGCFVGWSGRRLQDFVGAGSI